MMIKKTTQGISLFSTVPHISQVGNVHPFTQQPIKTIQERVVSHPLLTRPTKQEIYPEHLIGIASMPFYREKQNQGISKAKQPTNQPILRSGQSNQKLTKSVSSTSNQSTNQPVLKIVSSTTNPFTKGLGGLGSGGLGGLGGIGGIGPVSGTTTLKTTPENTLPFQWKGYSTPTLPPTTKTTTETPIPKMPPLGWEGVRTITPTPIIKTTQPVHGVPTQPPNQGTQKSTQPTEPTQPQIDTNADYGVLGAIVMMLLPFIL
ncbi:MAG: hypothetical protein QXV17_11725 [Candidatus Micrarchaeaceae archaeon]